MSKLIVMGHDNHRRPRGVALSRDGMGRGAGQYYRLLAANSYVGWQVFPCPTCAGQRGRRTAVERTTSAV